MIFFYFIFFLFKKNILFIFFIFFHFSFIFQSGRSKIHDRSRKKSIVDPEYFHVRVQKKLHGHPEQNFMVYQGKTGSRKKYIIDASASSYMRVLR